jgi:tetratricopeptide (TPR) repeat protein
LCSSLSSCSWCEVLRVKSRSEVLDVTEYYDSAIADYEAALRIYPNSTDLSQALECAREAKDLDNRIEQIARELEERQRELQLLNERFITIYEELYMPNNNAR